MIGVKNLKDLSIKVFLNPNSGVTPAKLREDLLRLNLKIRVKEKCYGLLIHGEYSQVKKITYYLQSKYKNETFIKESSPHVKGSRVFTGFLQTAGEYRSLFLISKALKDIEGEVIQSSKDIVWEKPPIDTNIYKSRIVRCEFIPGKRPEALLMHRQNGDVVVRCPSGKEYCVWYVSMSCPYGLLEHNLHYWCHTDSTYQILRCKKKG